MLGGLCLANAKLGAVHGYAAIIGEKHGIAKKTRKLLYVAHVGY